jgi:hypothetical protein
MLPPYQSVILKLTILLQFQGTIYYLDWDILAYPLKTTPNLKTAMGVGV